MPPCVIPPHPLRLKFGLHGMDEGPDLIAFPKEKAFRVKANALIQKRDRAKDLRERLPKVRRERKVLRRRRLKKFKKNRVAAEELNAPEEDFIDPIKDGGNTAETARNTAELGALLNAVEI